MQAALVVVVVVVVVEAAKTSCFPRVTVALCLLTAYADYLFVAHELVMSCMCRRAFLQQGLYSPYMKLHMAVAVAVLNAATRAESAYPALAPAKLQFHPGTFFIPGDFRLLTCLFGLIKA